MNGLAGSGSLHAFSYYSSSSYASTYENSTGGGQTTGGIYLGDGTAANGGQTGAITFSSTTAVISWSKSSTPSGTYQCSWSVN